MKGRALQAKIEWTNLRACMPKLHSDRLLAIACKDFIYAAHTKVLEMSIIIGWDTRLGYKVGGWILNNPFPGRGVRSKLSWFHFERNDFEQKFRAYECTWVWSKTDLSALESDQRWIRGPLSLIINGSNASGSDQKQFWAKYAKCSVPIRVSSKAQWLWSEPRGPVDSNCRSPLEEFN